MSDLTRKTILDLIAGRIVVNRIWGGSSNLRISLDCEEFEGKTDDPLALALIDYLATGNFASLAVVLDEEAARIDEEMNKPVTDDDLLEAGLFLDVAHGARKIARCKKPSFDLIDMGYKPSQEWWIPASGILVTRRFLAALLSAKHRFP